MTNVYSPNGASIILGKEIGSGGEGKILEVKNEPDLVAKIYHKAIDKEKSSKLLTMVKIKNNTLVKVSAWPLDILVDKKQHCVGFLMNKVSGYKEIHKLYGPKTRLSEFPNADWAFLVHAATNLAKAFNTIHDNGQIIGDVNHSNIVVAENALVKLIDCDSFQINDNGKLFSCDVGVSTHQPPEFQDKSSFRGLARTYNHDNFGLAVLLFQLLFMGRHPFSGQYLGSGEMSLEKAIKECRFAYGQMAAQMSMRQPPGTLQLSALPGNVATLFDKAFSHNGINGPRPTARDWIIPLQELASKLMKCGKNSGHKYYNASSTCPFCSIEMATGILLFNATLSIPGETFDINIVWNRITAISSPGNAPEILNNHNPPLNPSPLATKFARGKRSRKLGAWCFGLTALFALFILPIKGFWFFVSLIVTWIITVNINSDGDSQKEKEFINKHREAQNQFKLINERWMKEAGSDQFLKKVQDLTQAKEEYLNLDNLKRYKLQKLNNDRRKRQLELFLDRHRISDAVIQNIGSGRKATLQSFAIETALDVSEQAIRTVPGFGPALTFNLIMWRNSIEKMFVFDPNKGVDPTDINNLNREIIVLRQKLQSFLQNGPTELQSISKQILSNRVLLKPELDRCYLFLAQSEADYKVIRNIL